MKYILGVVALFLVTIFAIVMVTRGRGNQPQQQGERQISVAQYAKPGTSAVFTTQGRLVGQTERKAIRVKVSEDERRLEILTGYEEAVEQAYVFPNTDTAYETFLVALDRAGFARKRAEVTGPTDERGACPLGKRYIYEFKEYSQQLSRLWSSTCGSKAGGTFGGSASTIRRLFERQIPDYSKRIRDVDL